MDNFDDEDAIWSIAVSNVCKVNVKVWVKMKTTYHRRNATLKIKPDSNIS